MSIKSYIHYIATNIIEYKSEFQFKKVSYDATYLGNVSIQGPLCCEQS